MKYKSALEAIAGHGFEVIDWAWGADDDDRMIQYDDGFWGFQIRGSAEVYVFPNQADAIEEYERM